MAVTSKILTARGRKQARELGIDPQRLPPGQVITRKFPVFNAGRAPLTDEASWSLSIWGEVEAPYSLRWDELMALEQVEVVCDIHCVTRWSKLDTAWRGVRVRDLLARARPLPSGTHVMAHCDGGYTTNLPIEALLDDDVLVTHTYDGRPLAFEHGAPARLLVPRRYFWKSAKYLRGLEVMSGDRPGFWEANGYHNDGDPWREERTHADPLAFRSLRRQARGVSDGP